MSSHSPFSPIESILHDIRAGKMVIITDDADRENEGDLVCAAQAITPQIVNFMAKHTRAASSAHRSPRITRSGLA